MKKRTIAYIAAAVALVGAIGGCASGKNADTKEAAVTAEPTPEVTEAVVTAEPVQEVTEAAVTTEEDYTSETREIDPYADYYIDDKYGFKLTIPDSWKGKYVGFVDTGDYHDDPYNRIIIFYEKTNYTDANSEIGGPSGAEIAFFVCDKNKLRSHNCGNIALDFGDDYKEIAEKDDIVIVTACPTDVPSKDEYMEKWRALGQDKSSLIESFEWIN
jgi:hypothetical protein